MAAWSAGGGQAGGQRRRHGRPPPDPAAAPFGRQQGRHACGQGGVLLERAEVDAGHALGRVGPGEPVGGSPVHRGDPVGRRIGQAPERRDQAEGVGGGEEAGVEDQRVERTGGGGVVGQVPPQVRVGVQPGRPGDAVGKGRGDAALGGRRVLGVAPVVVGERLVGQAVDRLAGFPGLQHVPSGLVQHPGDVRVVMRGPGR
jgi:hypothetical protein